MFDWQRFLDSQGIEYSERGASTAKGNLYVKCPFCGDADQGKHMGLSTAGRGWGCWRNQQHRGRAPERLIQALLGCGWPEAARLAGKGVSGLPSGLAGFMDAVRGALGINPKAETRKPPLRPVDFRLFMPGGGPIMDYMRDRKFSAADLYQLAEKFDLHYAIRGDWSYRLIIPVHAPDGTWLTWTGRAINFDAKIRYKTLTSDPDKAGEGPLAVGPINDFLLNLPSLLAGGETLILAEGPFDAMRLSLFADRFDAKATCLFGKAISPAQIEWLVQLRPLYNRVVLLLDPDASLDALGVQARLAPLAIKTHRLLGQHDPGDMDAREICALLTRISGREGV